jgi:hypothetical protein
MASDDSLSTLTPADLAMFGSFGVDEALLRAAQVHRVTDAEARSKLGITRPGDMSGIVFPYPDPADGHWPTRRLRRDHPDVGAEGKVKDKYLCPYGDNRHLYFPPGAGALLRDLSVPAVFVEAEKSALAITALAEKKGRRILAIATGGCWGWRGKIGIGATANGEREEESGSLADLWRIQWKHRQAIIAFDSNVTTNERVQSARRDLAETLAASGAKVYLVTLPQGPGINGPDDFIAVRGGEAFLQLIDDEVTFSDLAQISPAEYERARKVKAKALGIRTPALDIEVEARRRAQPGAGAQRKAADWAVRRERLNGLTVDGAALLARIENLITRFVILKPAQTVVIALWVLHTYAIDAFDYTPYLDVGSPEKRCAKTLLLELLELLTFHSWRCDKTTAAALLRSVERDSPTLLLDEWDSSAKGADEYVAAMSGLLNSGFRRGGSYRLCDKGPNGEIVLHDWPTFCCKAIAAIGGLKDTQRDRSVPIMMRRKSRNERVARFRRREVAPEATVLRDDCEAWAMQFSELLRKVRPELPEALNDRQQDVSEPLFAVAVAAGGEWTDRARQAVVELYAGEAAKDDSIRAKLLADIRTVFFPQDDGKALPAVERIASEDLAKCLGEMEDRPWAEWGKSQRPITQPQLARLLGRFGITPKTVRLSDGRRLKGYKREWFEDAWIRYAPPSTPILDRDSVTGHENTGDSGDFQSVTATSCHASENAVPANKDADCHGVTVHPPPTGAQKGFSSLAEGESLAASKPAGMGKQWRF